MWREARVAYTDDTLRPDRDRPTRRAEKWGVGEGPSLPACDAPRRPGGDRGVEHVVDRGAHRCDAVDVIERYPDRLEGAVALDHSRPRLLGRGSRGPGQDGEGDLGMHLAHRARRRRQPPFHLEDLPAEG